ncbi:neural cell adhesion molecule 2-like [Anneissia japonica]|uniref:neural cell adhesion molecule 2-like n=1 Tax=Anneissia japonica TaxID=1529436 RepID=UPI00142591A7|nr:neural cell adhesion molecule 2-like [Anneissia japonica]
MDLWRILVLVVASVGLSAGQVSLQPSGPTILQPVGLGVTVYCVFQGIGSFQPTWRDPQNNEITPSGGLISVTYISSTNSKLEISSLRESDTGVYVCDSPGGQKSIAITAYKTVEFTNTPSEQSFEIYTDARVICEPTSIPTSTYEWKFGTKNIEAASDQKYTIESLKYLQINNISSQDGGVYTCQATVLGGNYETNSRHIAVQVLVPPKITLGPQDFKGILGKNAQFKCIAIGDPQPVYTWKKNNVEIVYGNHFSIQNGGQLLVINNLQSDDFGSYKCVASVAGLPNKDAEYSAILSELIPPTVQEDVEVTIENGKVTSTCSQHSTVVIISMVILTVP